MTLVYNGINLGTPDGGNGTAGLRAGGLIVNTAFADVYNSLNAVISAIGLATDTSTNLGALAGTIIPDGRTVKQALEDLESYAANLNVLDPGYAAGAAVAPVAGDSLEAAIAKLHALLNALDQSVVLKGTWDASVGTFPGGGTAQAGFSYIVSVAGTVNAVSFNVGDRIIAILDNASTSLFANNWFKADYTDQVGSVFGRQGAVVATAGDYTAAQITNTPAGNISAATVQAAINELDGEKLAVSLLAAKGSIVTATAANAPTELGVGVDGTALTADSTTASGLRYSAQLERRLDVGSVATSQSPSAATSVDVVNYLTINPTAANLTLTIPNPTVTTRHRTIVLENLSSTQSISVLFTSGTGFVLTNNNIMSVTWNGSAWVAANAQLAVGASYSRGIKAASQASVAAGTTILFDTVQSFAANDISLNVGTGVFTLSAGKTYRLRAAPGQLTPVIANTRSAFGWVNNTASNTAIGNVAGFYSPSDAASNIAYSGTAEAIISPTVDTQVSFRCVGISSSSVTAGSNADFTGGSVLPWYDIEVIANNAPILGTTVDYSYTYPGNVSVAGNDLTSVTQLFGNIPLAAGLWTLKAGKTYRLSANLLASSVSATGASIAWVDSTNNEIGGGVGPIGSGRILFGSTAVSLSSGEIVYTPTVDTQVKLRGQVGTVNLNSNGSSIVIQQIGSTAFTGLVRQRTTLGSQFNSASHNTLLDVTNLTAIVVPAGTYRIKVNLNMGIENNGAGSMYTGAQLMNVTAGNVIEGAQFYGPSIGYTTGFTATMRGPAYYERVVTNAVPTTYKIQVIKGTTGGSPNTVQNLLVDAGSYVEVEQAL